MRIVQRELLSLALVTMFGAAGCSHEKVVNAGFSACKDGDNCEFEGELDLLEGEPAWAAVISNGKTCAKIALPDSFYVHADEWRGKQVVVRGRAFEQPGYPEQGALMWFSEKGRKLSMGACDQGIAIFAESMRSSGGKVWQP